MISRFAGAAHAWIFTLLLAIGFVAATGYARAQRIRFLSDVALEAQRLDSGTLSGRLGETRELILPEASLESAHWIIQTQQMLGRHEWRVRHIDYENAPHGRPVSTGSPYRWWLGAVAWGLHAMSGRSLSLSVEEAALWADPLLHILLIVGTTVFVWRHFGALTASLTPLGLATLFPFATSFQPGAPDDAVLGLAAVLWSILPLLAGLAALDAAGATTSTTDLPDRLRRARGCFIIAGISGGLGLWVGVSAVAPSLAGIVVGACLASWLGRSAETTGRRPASVISSSPWWSWGIAGSATAVAAFVIEYAPAHLATWQLRNNHPLYAGAWLGAAALIVPVTRWLDGSSRPAVRSITLALCGAAALLAVPGLMLVRDDPGFLARDASAHALTRFSGEAAASSVFAWVARDGMSRALIAAVLPLSFVVSAFWILRRRDGVAGSCRPVALALGPVAVFGSLALWRLGAWGQLDATLLTLFIGCTAAVARPHPSGDWRGLWIGLAAVVLGLGATQVVRPLTGGVTRAADESEFSSLVHRDLAHWLARRTLGTEPVILAPPDESLALAYYGGLRGLGTLDWENVDGIRAATRVLRSTSPEEGEALFGGRGLTHVILPSWDRTLDLFAGGGTGGAEGSFLDALRQLSIPAWMRPVPYQLPGDAKAVGRSVIVLEVVEEQSEALELSRLADYFVEMGQLEFAAAVGQTLRRFPADLGAWIARVQVEMAVGSQPASAASLPNVISIVENSGDRILPWDRRVALAVVLARGQRMDLAREQVRRCLASAGEEQLRALTSGPLYRLLYLARTFKLDFADPELGALALELLPAESRGRLATAAPR